MDISVCKLSSKSDQFILSEMGFFLNFLPGRILVIFVKVGSFVFALYIHIYSLTDEIQQLRLDFNHK